MQTLKVVAWNLAHGTNDGTEDQISCLTRIADELLALDADIVLLNEICRWNAVTYGGVDQIEWLRNRLMYDHVAFERAATLAFKGEKLVCVFSKTPLFNQQRIEHSAYADGGGYATLLVRTYVNGRTHHIFSTRLTAWDVPENIRSHETLLEIVKKIPDSDNIILGGDFNTGAGADADWPLNEPRTIPLETYTTSGRIRHALGMLNYDGGADQLFVRGNYNVANSGFFTPNPNPSNHPYIFADLQPALNGAKLLELTAPSRGVVDSPIPFSVKFLNTGGITWERAHLYRLSLSPADLFVNSDFIFDEQIYPGNEFSFNGVMNFRATGNHVVRLQMKQIGASDFGDAKEINIEIIPEPQIFASIEPEIIILNRPTTLTITATDSISGASVFGNVYINSKKVGATGSPINYTFKRRMVDGEWEYPSGYVIAANYLPTDLQFGFP